MKHARRTSPWLTSPCLAIAACKTNIKMLKDIPQSLTAPVNEKAKRLSGVRPRLLETDPCGVDRYLYNLNLFKQSIALQLLHVRAMVESIKNAGGNLPATSTAFVDGEVKEITKGNPSSLRQPSIAERWSVYTILLVKPLVEPFPSELVQVVLLEGAPFAKELGICRPLVFCLVFKGSEFNRAKKICKLQQPIIGRVGVLVDNCIFSKDVFDCIVQGFSYDCLSVVVIDLNFIEFLKVCNVVEKAVDQLSLHSVEKFACIVLKFAFFVGEGHIAEWQMGCEDSEARKIAFPGFNGKLFVAFMLGQKWTSMHRYIGKPFVSKVDKVNLDIRGDVVFLLVKYERNEVVARSLSDIARFVYEYRKLFIHCSLLKNKNAGGNPPALGGRPFREDQLLYTTTQGVLSRYNYTRTHVLKHQVKG